MKNLYFKEYRQEDEKKIHRIGENIYKFYNS